MRSIVLATRNRAKLREIHQVLADLPVKVIGLELADGIAQPEETGQTFAQNARQKADYYAAATGRWCLADDSGLVVDALGGMPGVRSARYAAESHDRDTDRQAADKANNQKLLAELKDVPQDKRTARFVCHLALSDGEAVVLEATGVVEGRIAAAPRGHNGFGYDPVFIADQADRTMAELSAEQKNAISHRGQAIRQFAGLLEDFLQGHSTGQ